MRVERAWNPIALCHDPVITEVADWLSPNQIISQHALVFRRPVMCMVNGQFWSRKDWNCIVPAGGIVRFVELPLGGGDSNPMRLLATIALMAAAYFIPGMIGLTGFAGSLLSAAIMVGGSLLLNMLFPVETPGSKDYGTPKSVYSVSGSANRLRIGEPFAEHFGRMLCYPDLVQVSYTTVIDNEQYLYFLGFVGVGSYDIEGVYLDKTPIGDYAEAVYNIIGPGESPMYVTNVVWSSAEISGQELSTDYLTAIVSGAGTSAIYIEYDVFFRQLVSFNDAGDKKTATVTVETEVRLVDYRGIATTGWTALHVRTYSAASIDPLRYSNKIPAPLGPGRYEFRIRRTTEKGTDSRLSDSVSVIGLRAYGGAHPDYGDVTMIEAKIRATDQLNGDVASKINVVATRKLNLLGSTGFSTSLIPTRSIVDAVAYIATSDNGGLQDSTFLRLDLLAELKDHLDNTLDDHFDWRFTARTTVMEACVKAAKCGRSVPYMPGGQLALMRDEKQSFPKMVFTDDDFDQDSLTLTHTFATADAYTCVIVRYIDGDTWQDESVTYYDGRGSELNPYVISLDGCTGRQQAWELASYLYLDMMGNTINAEFTTGLKGHLPSVFDKIMISATTVDWGQYGKIAAVEAGKIWLTEPVDFGGDTTGKLVLTLPGGAADGPFIVGEIPGNPYCVAGTIPGLLTLQDDDLLATSFVFGKLALDPLYIRLLGIQPQGRNKVRLFGNIVTDSVYDWPGAAPDAISGIPGSAPLLSVTVGFVAAAGENNEFSALWIGSAGEFMVEVDSGSGFVTIEVRYSGYQKTFIETASSLSVRVTPYVDGTLYTAGAVTGSYTIVPAPVGLTLDNADADSVDVSWTAVAGATLYEVAVWAGGSEMGSKGVGVTYASVTTSELAAMGGPWPNFEVRLNAVAGSDKGLEAILPVSIPAMVVPSGLTLQSVLTGGVMLSWSAVAGATGYKLYVGTSAGFDPGTQGTLVYAGSSLSAIAVVSVTPPYDHFFKVAGTNGYYQDAADLVFSSALEVVA